MLEQITICVWKIISQKEEVRKLDNSEFDYCREICSGKNENCRMYLRSEYSPEELVKLDIQYERRQDVHN